MLSVRSYLLLMLSSLCFLPTFAQRGLGAGIWEDAQDKYPRDAHYRVIFSFERHSPMMRSSPEKASMIYSKGQFAAFLPSVSWFYNGDTLWEYAVEERRVLISEEMNPDAFSPSEIIDVLARRPVSVKHHGQQDHNGEICDRLKLDLSGRGLSYESVFLWINQDQELRKLVFLDRWQVSTTIHIFRIEPIDPPPSSAFRYSP